MKLHQSKHQFMKLFYKNVEIKKIDKKTDVINNVDSTSLRMEFILWIHMDVCS